MDRSSLLGQFPQESTEHMYFSIERKLMASTNN